MKFISKNSNLRIILEPGLQAQPLSGIPARPTIFVKFNMGLAEINEEEIIKKMLSHSGFNTDFIAVDDKGDDPFAYRREETEPSHYITEMKYGHAEKSMSSAKKPKLSPELIKMINDLANERVKEMLPSAIEGVIKQFNEKNKPVEASESLEIEDPKKEEMRARMAKAREAKKTEKV